MRKLMLGMVVLLGFSMAAQAAGTTTNRWLHVRVVDSKEGETVNVNVPLSMAEMVLPAINQKDFHGGRITIDDADMKDVNLPMLLDAIRNAPDNEFVTVKSADEDVRVAKEGGNLIVRVRENADKSGKDDERVDVTVPMRVVTALIAKGQNQLDLNAALRELETLGDTTLVTVNEATETVRIWVDSQNTSN
jgi:hypothetical protein